MNLILFRFVRSQCVKNAVLCQDESLGGWRVKRTIDGVDKAEYRFDSNYVLRAGAKAKVRC